jgi:hypothetical protein
MLSVVLTTSGCGMESGDLGTSADELVIAARHLPSTLPQFRLASERSGQREAEPGSGLWRMYGAGEQGKACEKCLAWSPLVECAVPCSGMALAQDPMTGKFVPWIRFDCAVNPDLCRKEFSANPHIWE